MTWFGRAAKRGDASALRKAADQGDASAQLNLGLMYAEGDGVLQDDAAAMTWYRRAADQGFAKAQCYIGVMYEIGRVSRRTMLRR